MVLIQGELLFLFMLSIFSVKMVSTYIILRTALTAEGLQEDIIWYIGKVGWLLRSCKEMWASVLFNSLYQKFEFQEIPASLDIGA